MPQYCTRLPEMPTSGGWSATLPEVTVQGAGSIPILSFTADEIRWVQPR